MNTSLSKFCKDTELPKTSVYRRCQELGIDLSNGLTPSTCERLRYEFNVPAVSTPSSSSITPDLLPQNFLQPGQLAPVEERAINLPPGFDASAMVCFFDGVVGEATDTRSLVAIADLALSAVETAMDTKVKAQRQKLTQAEQDAQTLSEKINDAKTNLKIKALESRLLAEQQTRATQSAEHLFADLMAMGKPPSAPDTATSS